MKSRSLVFASALLLLSFLAARPVNAQTQPTPPAPGSTTSGPGGSGTITVEKDIDLPVEQPAVSTEKPKPPAPPDPPPPSTTDQPPSIYGKDLQSENGTIFYVIDISGSMAWDHQPFAKPDGSTGNGCRLDRAKVELTKSVLSLPKTFKFNMLAFDCSVYFWQQSLVAADDANKNSAIGWINGLRPQGATGTGPAVVQALATGGSKLVVLLTDGGPNCGAGDGHGGHTCRQAHRTMIAAANSGHAVINVFGISASGDMKTFCMEVASDAGGSYIDVP